MNFDFNNWWKPAASCPSNSSGMTAMSAAASVAESASRLSTAAESPAAGRGGGMAAACRPGVGCPKTGTFVTAISTIDRQRQAIIFFINTTNRYYFDKQKYI